MNRIAIRAGLCLVVICILAALTVQKRSLTADRAAAVQAAEMFVEALAAGDLNSARLLSWGVYLNATLKPPAFESFRDAQIVEILDAQPTLAQNRPDDYRGLHKMMSVGLRIKTTRHDDSGNPPGKYMLFILVVQPEQGAKWAVAETGSAP